jgi:serine/threonine protein kinase
VKRFHQEARAAGAIGHPNICEVYDLGTLEDGAPYLVMERLVGETLADRIASEGGLPFDDVIDIHVQVLSGLVAAHEKGIVHRDIKPENVFLTKRVGCPPLAKLLDFGVSKMITPLFSGDREEDLDLTRTGMVMGTPFYMSPEQARGDRNLDARVDLYACGVMLYEALTGKRPFTAANYNALLLQILTTKPRPARELRPALPMGFDELLDKALARSRDERFQSSAEFQRELQALRDRHPKTAVGMDVSEMQRHAAQLRRSTPMGLQQPPTPRGAPRPMAQEPEPEPEPVSVREPTPSSVEIPILFSDTPLSGEQMPELRTSDHELISSAEPTAIEDFPTEIGPRSRERFPTSSDTDTTERRADLSHLGLGKRPRAGNLRPQPVAVKPAAPPVATPRPAQVAVAPRVAPVIAPRVVPPKVAPKSRPQIDVKATDTDVDDNNATLIQSSPIPRRRTNRPVSPDDTIRMESQPSVPDARERMPSQDAAVAPRGPKLPRP